ncbi:MAG TPA: sigma-54 dependent transcriptional regulator [Alphaproteobacteria bacterium]
MRLLIIGTLAGQLGEACKIAVARGARVVHADDIAIALHNLRSGAGGGADLVMIDVALDVGQLTRSLAAEHINVPVIACGMGNDSRAAVAAIKAGAKEYLPLPPDPDMIAAVLEAVTEENHRIVFEDPAMREVLDLAERIARSDASILITGDSGTGKEILARHIHARSRRSAKPFVSVNCAAIPEALLESELFGHEKGAFTGAIARRIGKFEAADGGTLLLDEIGEMDLKLQAKLLRVLQEREIDRVGGTRPVKIDIRLLATTNRDLQQQVAARNFREDLYFRINVVTVHIPPLRERTRDILLLAEHFIGKYAEANGLAPRPLSKAAAERLLRHAWPGNVRELENNMHRAVLLATGPEIGPEAMMLGGGAGPAAIDGEAGRVAGTGGASRLVGRTVAAVERDLIIDTLDHCLGNRTHAATILGISIRTLRNKLKAYDAEGVAVPPPAAEARAAGL